MKKLRFGIKLVLFSFAVLIAGCSKEHSDNSAEKDVAVDSYGKSAALSHLKQGKVVVKVTDELSNRIEETGNAIRTLSVGVKSASTLNELGIKKMERVFPYAGRFEKRTKECGMHLWYEIEFDESCPITKATDDISSLDGIEAVEFVPKIILVGNPVVNPFENSLLDGMRQNEETSGVLPFNDPQLPRQWHYYNTGSIKNSYEGCDINVIPVWNNYTKGDSRVIVSVVDGGVDYSHEDLKDNMWRNSEETGNKVYGWNFVKNGPLVTADEHGTHVAGTISAVNNNGKGVCGIAGGDYDKGIRGALIMSCQIFDGKEQGNGAAAIKWGADHGAVISQNSWGFEELDYTPLYVKDAIDYFITYAGYDENNNQVGPMAGGVVIFAAGNDNKNIGYPASYEPVIAVSAIGADFTRAYYSNYGDWTDLTAPGGDAQKGNYIISTLPGNQYGIMQGTSMACPHVSGIAALVVSHLGGPGFTNTMLRTLLEKSCRDISSFNKSKQIAGLVDAQKAVSGASKIAPDRITDLKLSPKNNTVLYSFSVPKDEDDYFASSAIIYYSKDKNDIPDKCSKVVVSLGGYTAGKLYEGTLENLDFDCTYYVAAVAADMAGNQSAISDIVQTKTSVNLPPVVKALDGTDVSFKSYDAVTLKFEIIEPEGQKYSYSFDPLLNGTTVTVSKDNILTLTISGPILAKDLDLKTDHSFTTTLTVTDEYNASSTISISCTVLKNNPPVIVNEIENMILHLGGESISLDMSKYFNDEDGEQLKYTFNLSHPKVASFSQNGNIVYVTAMSLGISEVTVTAADALGQSVKTTFNLLVSDRNNEFVLYPQPATDYFYIRSENEFSGTVTLHNSLGAKALEQTVTSSPFNPAKVDISKLSGGVYTMTLSIGGKEIKRNVVKL